MKYKNISEKKVTVQTAEGSALVAPGEEVLTAPRYGAPLVEAGVFELVSSPSGESKTTRSKKGDEE